MSTSTTSHPSVRELDATMLDELVATSEVPVLVDFWATWCGPCVPMARVLDAYAVEEADRLVVGSVDIDAHPDLARRFAVMSAPTLLLFVDGRLVDRWIGARGPGRLREDLAPHLDRD